MTACCTEYNYNNPLPVNSFLRMLQETVCFTFSCIIVRGYIASTISFKFQFPSSPSPEIISFSTWEWRRRCEECKKGTKCSLYVKRLICEIHSFFTVEVPKIKAVENIKSWSRIYIEFDWRSFPIRGLYFLYLLNFVHYFIGK